MNKKSSTITKIKTTGETLKNQLLHSRVIASLI